ncbi:MAG TPA: xanthine dehydrogenase family protein molybdopterin-binding subunit [Solirubrobacteraceae bacterium]|jgi:carbon-monoxide dehydrogenase large subunit
MGARILRREDQRLLRGGGRYVSDVTLPGLLHGAFVRSTLAHARIIELDLSRARAVPGVVAAFGIEDLRGLVRPMRAISRAPGYRPCATPVLADGKVRMVGEPIALIVAESRYLAEDGAAAVGVKLEPLTPLLTMDEALADGAPVIHDEAPQNLFNSFEQTIGDLEATFAAADEVIDLEIEQQRYGAVAMEGRVAVASYSAAEDRLTAWLSTQVPHIARTGLAKHLSMPENRVRVIAPDVGGGFGPKCVLYQEDLAVCGAAKLVGRPVKWASDRIEDLQTTIHGREQTNRLRAAASSDGRVLAVQADLRASNGAYAVWPYTAGLDSGQASENVTGPYDIRCYERRVRAVVTNKAPMGPYRGVGRVLAAFSIERVMDVLADRLGIDPLEIRRRNLVREFPYTTATGLRFESGDYLRMVDTLAEAMDWERVREENAALRASGVIRGIGVAFAVEQSAYGAKAMGSRQMEMTFGYDTASVRFEPDGRVRVAVGLHNHGQGHETTIAQIASEELGVPVGDIDVVWGDTAVVPYGLGTWASRSTVACGGATILAAQELREKIVALAADMLEARPDDLELVDGAVAMRGSRSQRVPIAAVARRALHEPHLLPEGMEPGLEVTRRFMPPDPGSFAAALHGAHVELVPDTGHVRVLSYVVVEDCGTVVNPMIVDGQVHGGVAQGIGGALMEHLVYDEQGSLVTTTLMDYLVPTAAEIPPIRVLHQESPSPFVPGGFKGMGEGGAVNAPVAIVAAVNDALGAAGNGANHTPLTPEWVLAALKNMNRVEA